jgi:serine/threonine-protein kinase
MAGVMVAALWMYVLLAKPAQITDRRVVLPWALLVAALYVGIAGFGVFSPALLVFVLAVYFVGQRHALWTALTVYGLGALTHLGLVVAISLGVLVDPGVITAEHLGMREVWVTETLVQLTFVGSFWVARASLRATTETMEELQRATRTAAQREALLVEARDELERAMRVGGAGRFTDHVLGSFRLGAVLGRGAMGEVYEARREPSGEPAAVKLIRAEALGQPGLLERFLREAHATSKLDSPHVVRVLEVGDETAPLPYIAMERLHGHDLAFYLRARPRLPGAEVADLLAQLARGVDAAHRAGIVHRDIKPQNVFLHETPGAAAVWKILDFGVSKLRDQDATINPGQIVGTPAYMAPEQISGAVVDGRADVYALGVIAFRALTGEPPFRGCDTPELLYNVVHAATPLASRRTPELSPAVDAVLARALAKKPDDRFACAADLAAALAQALLL